MIVYFPDNTSVFEFSTALLSFLHKTSMFIALIKIMKLIERFGIRPELMYGTDICVLLTVKLWFIACSVATDIIFLPHLVYRKYTPSQNGNPVKPFYTSFKGKCGLRLYFPLSFAIYSLIRSSLTKNMLQKQQYFFNKVCRFLWYLQVLESFDIINKKQFIEIIPDIAEL